MKQNTLMLQPVSLFIYDTMACIYKVVVRHNNIFGNNSYLKIGQIKLIFGSLRSILGDLNNFVQTTPSENRFKVLRIQHSRSCWKSIMH